MKCFGDPSPLQVLCSKSEKVQMVGRERRRRWSKEESWWRQIRRWRESSLYSGCLNNSLVRNFMYFESKNFDFLYFFKVTHSHSYNHTNLSFFF